MSKTSRRINKMKERLDDISGLDGFYVHERLDKIEETIEKYVTEIEKHSDEDEMNCTIFEGQTGPIVDMIRDTLNDSDKDEGED